MQAQMMNEWEVKDRKVALSTPTIALGVVATVATTTACTLLAHQGSEAPVQKFATSSHGLRTQTRTRAQAGKMTRMNFGEDAGVLPPVGYLDPLGFGEKASPDRLRWFREAELKHGRIAMLASVGFLIGENPDLKTALFPDNPEYAGSNGLASNTFTDHNLDNFWYAFVAGAGVLEAGFFEKFDDILDWKLSPDYAVGDLGFDPLGLKPEDEEAFMRKRTIELQNGRLGMLAIAGFNAQELTDGKPIWPIHGLDSKASAAELDSHIHKGMDLVKEMGQMLADTAPHH
jgi:hypothetical protein